MVVRDCRQDRRHTERTGHDAKGVCPTGGTLGSRGVPLGGRYAQLHAGDAGQDFGCVGGAADTDLNNYLIL